MISSYCLFTVYMIVSVDITIYPDITTKKKIPSLICFHSHYQQEHLSTCGHLYVNLAYEHAKAEHY